MKITSLEITGVGGIRSLAVNFDPQMNIVCGPNGIGKTTLLECAAHCFSVGQTSILKRHVGLDRGEIRANLDHRGAIVSVDISLDQFEPTQQSNISGKYDWAPYLLSLKTTRTFTYTPVTAVGRDTAKDASTMYEEAKGGVQLADLKNWLVNRYLYSAHSEALSTAQLANFELAKRCFSELDPEFTFARINASNNEILINTPAGTIYYEYLSSGFKSCLSILFGIIKEIEFRFQADQLRAEDFDGIVLIDEIELHLHPEWQYRIPHVLTRIFPKVQFIVTTHSPHVIQSADPNQIVALEFQNGEVKERGLPESGFGFKGWTLDEVLTDVMGMTDTRTEEYRDLMAAFGVAVEREDYPAASNLYTKLDASLHPANHIRKLLRLQLGSITPEHHDPA